MVVSLKKMICRNQILNQTSCQPAQPDTSQPAQPARPPPYSRLPLAQEGGELFLKMKNKKKRGRYDQTACSGDSIDPVVVDLACDSYGKYIEHVAFDMYCLYGMCGLYGAYGTYGTYGIYGMYGVTTMCCPCGMYGMYGTYCI